MVNRIPTLKKERPKVRWIVESEFGLDIKRYFASVCKTEAEAKAKKAWLDIKDPYDKHTIIKVREVRK